MHVIEVLLIMSVASSTEIPVILAKYADEDRLIFFVLAIATRRFVILEQLCDANIASTAFQTCAACSWGRTWVSISFESELRRKLSTC